jgi:hypothetical protein
MSNVIQFPKPKKQHKQVVSVQEMYCQGNAFPDQMVWDMCRYTRSDGRDCEECPRWEKDPDYGRMQFGCFGMAQEACRYALAWFERMKHGGPYR